MTVCQHKHLNLRAQSLMYGPSEVSALCVLINRLEDTTYGPRYIDSKMTFDEERPTGCVKRAVVTVASLCVVYWQAILRVKSGQNRACFC